MTIEQLLKELGDDFYEIKRMLAGRFCAYSINDDKAIGYSFAEALENLLEIVKGKRKDES